jgi:hypothetical protein
MSLSYKENRMPLSSATGRYYQSDSHEFPSSISWQQLFVLHVATHYKLLRSSRGWWADGHVFADGVTRIHSPATVKSLVKSGLLQGNPRGENMALGDWDGKSTMEPPIAMLWTSEKAKSLLDKIESETGLVFDKENYDLIPPEIEEADAEANGITIGQFATKREAALAYDRAVILLYGEDAETNFPPEESEDVVLSAEVLRQINTLKAGRGRLQ